MELREWNAAFLSSASAKTSLQSIKSGMLLQHTNPHVRTHSHVACDLHEPSPEISIRLRHKHTHMPRQLQLYLHYSTHTTMQWNSSSFVLGPFRNTALTHTHTTPNKKKKKKKAFHCFNFYGNTSVSDITRSSRDNAVTALYSCIAFWN